MKLISENKLPHQSVRFAYLFNRSGVGYTCYNHERKSTNLYWIKENIPAMFKLLDERIEKYDTYFEDKPLYVEDLIAKAKSAFPNWNKTIEMAFKAVFQNKIKLDDKEELINVIANFKQNEKYSVYTKEQYISYIRRIFEFSMRSGYIGFDPTVNWTKKQRDIPPPPKEEAIEALLADLHNYEPIIQYLVKFILQCGLRTKEALSIRLEDFTEDGWLTVKAAKGGRIRYFPVYKFPEMVELVDEIKSNLSKDGYLFGVKYTNSLSVSINIKAKKRASWVNGFHAFRKYRENELIKLGYSDKTIAQLWGHSPTVQRSVYLSEDIVKHELEFQLPNDIISGVKIHQKSNKEKH